MPDVQPKQFVQFSSHSGDVVALMRELYHADGDLRLFFSTVFSSVREAEINIKPSPEILPRGFPLERWVRDSEEMDAGDARRSTINLVCVFIYHLCLIQQLHNKSVDMPAWASSSSGAVGHSVGLLSAIVYGLGLDKAAFERNINSLIRFSFCVSYRSEEAYQSYLLAQEVDSARLYSPMAMVQRIERSRVDHEIEQFSSQHERARRIEIGLCNADDIIVLAGRGDVLEQFRVFLERKKLIKETDWSYLAATAPFHSKILGPVWPRLRGDSEFTQFRFSGRDLVCPVYRTDTGANMQSENLLGESFVEQTCINMLDWPRTLNIIALETGHGLLFDFGPGPLIRLFTQMHLRKKMSNIKQISHNNKDFLLSVPLLNLGENITAVRRPPVLPQLRSNNMKMDVIVFPGQGSQCKGMGASLFERYPQLVQEADELLGYSIRDLCLDNSAGVLDRTDFTQPAIYLVNALHAKHLIEDEGLSFKYAAGHSLGEFNALQVAGAFDIVSGLSLVKERGRLMNMHGSGGMSAVIGLSVDVVLDVLLAFELDKLYVANINTPTQIVLSGDAGQMKEVESVMKIAGASNFIALKTSAAFHSPLMSQAEQEFSVFISNFEFSTLKCDVISNLTAVPYPEAAIPALISGQITKPVRWSDSIEYLLAIGAEKFYEVGDSGMLSKMIEAVRKHATGRTAELGVKELS
ncbi:ACP S-malonyltransferase [Rugamonas sp. DEMB1]|uniref:ACP S-malonyltransferase n=1 Tax=Rugamonas sp. DEMB1 TaxID=3039386 RepID=UPI002449A846|nr:ACP S-malonyltransferase [Rugamonas sp. DEMB1]WGG52467.1 ACP S-malonyltransferase [Rugamonas sp. DEMB1]